MKTLLLVVALGTALVGVEVSSVNRAMASDSEQNKQIAELERQKATLEGEIDIQRASIDKFNQLAAELDQEARECLAANPPRYSSAALFRAQANECRAEARKCQSAIRDAQTKIRQIDALLARLRSGR